MRRVGGVIAVIATVLALVPACQSNKWEQTAPFAPSQRPAFGARVTDGQLNLWMGTPCAAVTWVLLTFDPYQDDEAEFELTASPGHALEVDRLALDGPYPGFEVSKPLPQNFDWRAAESVMLQVDTLAGGGWGSETKIGEVVKGSADHPDDSYWFQDIGWLNPADVAAQDGKTFLTTCAPDPDKKPSVPAAFGARITGDDLRIWTGAPCASTTGITMAFEPSGNVLELKGTQEAAGVDFEHYTVGEPYPGLQIAQPLPAGFDWRTQETVLLSVAGTDAHQGLRADLAEVVKGSAAHSDDTYWFQGVGWLTPADVTARNGKTFVATCTPDPVK